MLALTLRFLLLLRLLCFMALVYLALHALFARLAKPESKVLWFFAVLTAPLLRPIRRWRTSQTAAPQLLHVALLMYGALWALTIVAVHLLMSVMSD